jgi:hypothetical protein
MAYLAFTLDHNEDEAAARFLTRFGAPPDTIIESHGILLVGPVPEEDAND